jgi:hypothetical protein
MQRAEHGALYLHDCGNPILPRELVLVAGGITGNSTITNTCEVLDITEPARQQYMASQESLAGAPSTSANTISDELAVVDNTGAMPSVVFTTHTAENVKIDIVGADGRSIARLADGAYPQGSYRQPIITTGLPNGVYFVRRESPSFRGVRRFVVMR